MIEGGWVNHVKWQKSVFNPGSVVVQRSDQYNHVTIMLLWYIVLMENIWLYSEITLLFELDCIIPHYLLLLTY